MWKIPDEPTRDQIDKLVLSDPQWPFTHSKYWQSKDMRYSWKKAKEADCPNRPCKTIKTRDFLFQACRFAPASLIHQDNTIQTKVLNKSTTKCNTTEFAIENNQKIKMGQLWCNSEILLCTVLLSGWSSKWYPDHVSSSAFSHNVHKTSATVKSKWKFRLVLHLNL